MDHPKYTSHRTLLTVLAALFVLSIAAFSYANWASDPEYRQGWRMLLNIPILAIPLVLAAGWREHARLGQVSPRLAKNLHRAPRAAAILIIFFVSLFSLDVFEMEASPLELLGGFLIHNIPSIGMLVLLITAWRRPAVGFAAFLAAAATFASFFVRDRHALPNLILFVLPMLLTAALFYADWQRLKPQPPAQAGAATQESSAPEPLQRQKLARGIGKRA